MTFPISCKLVSRDITPFMNAGEGVEFRIKHQDLAEAEEVRVDRPEEAGRSS